MLESTNRLPDDFPTGRLASRDRDMVDKLLAWSRQHKEGRPSEREVSVHTCSVQTLVVNGTCWQVPVAKSQLWIVRRC